VQSAPASGAKIFSFALSFALLSLVECIEKAHFFLSFLFQSNSLQQQRPVPSILLAFPEELRRCILEVLYVNKASQAKVCHGILDAFVQAVPECVF